MIGVDLSELARLGSLYEPFHRLPTLKNTGEF